MSLAGVFAGQYKNIHIWFSNFAFCQSSLLFDTQTTASYEPAKWKRLIPGHCNPSHVRWGSVSQSVHCYTPWSLHYIHTAEIFVTLAFFITKFFSGGTAISYFIITMCKLLVGNTAHSISRGHVFSISHKRHSIVRPQGGRVGCLLRFQILKSGPNFWFGYNHISLWFVFAVCVKYLAGRIFGLNSSKIVWLKFFIVQLMIFKKWYKPWLACNDTDSNDVISIFCL